MFFEFENKENQTDDNIDSNDNITDKKSESKIEYSTQDIKNKDWLYYTRCRLMDRYRDNLYRENFSIVALMSVRGEKNDKSIGLSLKLINNSDKTDYRINEMENFLFSILVDSAQKIENVEYKLSLEDFSFADAKLIRFLNSIYQDAEQKEEQGKLWFKNYSAYELLEILKHTSTVRFESRVINFMDTVLESIIVGEYDDLKNILFSLKLKDNDFDLTKVLTFGDNCPYILYKDTFYLTNPSYPKMLKDLFSSKVMVSRNYMHDFCARVLPHLKKDFNIVLPENIKESEEKYFPAQPLVFLDYDGSSVYAAIKFKYGRFTVDPYSGKITSSDMLDVDLSIYRDNEKENYLCDILAKYLDKEGTYTYSTSDDEKIFVLCYKALPTLQDKGWTFFYSESFRALRLNVKPPRMQVSLTKDIDFFEINFSFEGVKEIHDLSELISQVKEKNKEYIRLQNGSFVPVDLEIIDYLAKMLSETSVIKDDSNKYLLPMFSAPYFAEMLEKHSGVELNLEDNAKETITAIKNFDYDDEIPHSLSGTFRPYQLVGYKWLRKLANMQLNGILADDMGLGKSFQTIATILKEKQNGIITPNLIVAPTSCVANWYMEIKKFAPTLDIILLNGTNKARLKRIKSISNYDVGVISYSTLRRDIKLLSEKQFNYVILDEAQHIKNANTQNAKTVKSLNSQKRLALSGTPIENSISEMWSMFDFLMPGFFGKHRDFVDSYEAPILAQKEESSYALENLKTRISPFILRRLKTDVLKDLPAKHTNIAYCDLTKEQKELYMSILEAARLEIFETVKRKGFNQSHIEIFSALTRLRQVCCHPRLITPDIRGDIHTSGKFNLFLQMIREAIAGGHNVLVFSQFTRMLKIMAEALKKLNIDFLYLDGATKDRMDLVNRFNAGEAPIFLLSLKAAGTGLTLTRADTVIHYDLWWNPAVEDQATDRAYRIGQTRVVTNYKMVSRGTIEEKILALQNKKRELINSIVGDNVASPTKISWDEVKTLID